MKKNIKANVGGLLFNLDEDAYLALEQYLRRLDSHFENTEGKKEIIEDIERGIADMLTKKSELGKMIITIEDIEQIIAMMGEPWEIDANDNNSAKNQTQTSSGTKRLYRDEEEKVIAGVCSGISHYLNTDVAWIRILFVILLIFSGTGLIIYLVLWVAVPAAQSTAQKYEMKGEPLNIDSIEKRIKEEINGLGNQINTFKERHLSKKKSEINESLRTVGNSLGSAIGQIIRLMLIVIGVIFSIASIIIIGILFQTIFSNHGEIIELFHEGIYISVPGAIQAIVTSESDYNLIYYGLIGLVIIPFLSIIISGFGFLFNLKQEAKGVNKAFGILWVVALITISIMGFKTHNQFKNEYLFTEEIALKEVQNADTLKIMINHGSTDYPTIDHDKEKIYKRMDENFILLETENFYFGETKIEKYETTDTVFKIIVEKSSFGDKNSTALKNAKEIEQIIIERGNTIEISPLYKYSKKNSWRGQQIRIRIYKPENKHIKIELNTTKPNNEIFKTIEDEWREYLEN